MGKNANRRAQKLEASDAGIHPPLIEPCITEIQGQRIILDSDLARIYGVSTKILNQAVKRNVSRFPDDFVFKLSLEQAGALNRSQIVTGSQKHRDPRFLPFAFTEHGAIMAATILNSTRAVEMSVFVVRAFVRLRSALLDGRELERKLRDVEAELMSRLDVHEVAIVEILQRMMKLLDPPEAPPSPAPGEIGFHVKEESPPYMVKKQRTGN